MEKHSIFLLVFLLICLGCSNSKITEAVAIDIAKEKVQKEAVLDKIDINKMTIKFYEDNNEYFIDFAWKNASEITPGQWSEGYYVIIDAKNGSIKEATAYER